MNKPGEKICESCGSIVYPVWHRVDLSEEYGWVGNSTCPSCGNVQVHLAGAPSFVMSAHASLKEGGFLAD